MLCPADLQAGFRVGPGCPTATAALDGRLLPLVCADIDLIAVGQLRPKVGLRHFCGVDTNRPINCSFENVWLPRILLAQPVLHA